MENSEHDVVLRRLNPKTEVLSRGTARVLGHDVPAVHLRNLYGQELVFGFFGTKRGKLKRNYSSNAATEGVLYTSDCGRFVVADNPPFGDYE